MAPLINDVTTNLSDPVEFVSKTSLNPYPEAFKSQVERGYPDLKTKVLDGVTKEDAYAKCLAAAKKMPRWTLEHEDATAGVLEGHATTLVMRFKDDFSIRIREADGRSLIDMRSKSRSGKGDFGANAKRITQFFALLDE